MTVPLDRPPAAEAGPELLVQARYEPRLRARLLHENNLRLERMRFLCRIARDARVENGKGFQSTMRQLDEAERMMHGWRVAIGDRKPRPQQGASA